MSFEQDHHQCLEKLTWATQELQIAIEPAQLHKIASLIVQTMTGPWRYFHTPEHIFEVGGSDSPIEMLSALFHDVVYVQVDKSVNFNLSYYIVPFVLEIKEQLFIREKKELPVDRTFDLVLDLFGFQPGQALSPMGGQNEFLSAVVAGKVLEPFLPLSLIAKIAVCIEATIPFRGHQACDTLHQRLKGINEAYQLGLSPEEMTASVQMAVRMANRDVGSFANPSAARFLDGTWSLLPETNHNLHNSASYTVSEYRFALQKMEGFMNFLKPELIFHQYINEPCDQDYHALLSRSNRNLEIGRLYLGTKLFTIALLEALSFRLGKNIPMSTMMGELPSEEGDDQSDKLTSLIPKLPHKYDLKNDIEQEVLDLLEKGRYQEASYDLKNSPLSTYIVKCLGFEEIKAQLDRAKQFFQGKMTAEDFITGCDANVTKVITSGIVQLLEKRKTLIAK